MSGVRIRQDYAYVDEWKSLWEPDLEAIGYGGITTDPTKVDPKVLRWVKNNCGRQPHFIKVINPNSAHGRPGLTPSRASIYLVHNFCLRFVAMLQCTSHSTLGVCKSAGYTSAKSIRNLAACGVL